MNNFVLTGTVGQNVVGRLTLLQLELKHYCHAQPFVFFDVGMSSFVGFVLALWCSVARSAISVFVDKGKMKLCAATNAVFPDIIYDLC